MAIFNCTEVVIYCELRVWFLCTDGPEPVMVRRLVAAVAAAADVAHAEEDSPKVELALLRDGRVKLHGERSHSP